jgi:transcription elongation factor Elf1
MQSKKIPKERLAQLNDNFDCIVCNHVVIAPRECRNCGGLYCSGCFSEQARDRYERSKNEANACEAVTDQK